MAWLLSVCQKEMAAALFGSSPEISGKENSLRGRDPGSIAGHPIMEQEEARGKNMQGSLGNHEGPSWSIRTWKEKHWKGRDKEIWMEPPKNIILKCPPKSVHCGRGFEQQAGQNDSANSCQPFQSWYKGYMNRVPSWQRRRSYRGPRARASSH